VKVKVSVAANKSPIELVSLTNPPTKSLKNRQRAIKLSRHSMGGTFLSPRRVRIRVNGQEHSLDVPFERLLVDTLRDDLGLTGTKEGCGIGVCGACTVLMDGNMITSCLTPTVFADGREVLTIEGLASDEALHPLQVAFLQHGGLQCGFCTPGQILAAKALLDSTPTPTEQDVKSWMLGNLCRCTGYYKIIESTLAAAAALRSEGAQ